MQLYSKNLPKITLAEYRKLIDEGKNYVLFDSFVIDVTSFIPEHPGSSYTIKQLIGRDIGRYFYGAYHLESSVNPHKHSSFAFRVIVKLAVAKIEESDLVLFHTKSGNDIQIEEKTDKRDSNTTNNTSFFTVVDKTEIGDSLYRVCLEGSSVTVQNFNSGSPIFERSILVTSLQNNLSRYYTVCQCMWKGIYDEYITALLSATLDTSYSRKYETTTDYLNDSSNTIELVMKMYTESMSGISNQILKSNQQENEYKITGPYSKGLVLEPGTHIFIVAGTGILPLMDLFAYFARQLLIKYKSQYALFTDEQFDESINDTKFHIYAYYRSNEQAPGYQF